MNGLLYKNIIQSKFFLLITALLPPVIISFFIVFSMDFEKGFSLTTLKDSLSQYASSGTILRFVLYFACFFISIIIQNSIIAIDETKKWAYFIASTPNGVKKQVGSKYFIILILLGVCLISAILTDAIHCAVTKAVVHETMPSLTKIFTLTFFIVLLYFAIDIPFSIRFGVKKGAKVKCIIFAVILLCVVIYLLFGPLPENAGVILDAIYESIENLINNQLSDELLFIKRIIPVISIIGYIASYFISCRFFMKGVEEY